MIITGFVMTALIARRRKTIALMPMASWRGGKAGTDAQLRSI